MHSFGQYARGQCVQPHKKHSMIILQGKVEEQKSQMDLSTSHKLRRKYHYNSIPHEP